MEGVVASLEAGALFAGDYRVVKPLAAGGMGALYVVHQISTGKERALKLMRPELAADADLRKRFELEARVGAKIESAHVVEVHSAGVDAATSTPYLVMELLDGEDLKARVRSKGPMELGEVREMFEQLCHAVAAAHAAKVVHRDLKPDNVFLGRSKRAGSGRFDVKVLDFGIAKLVADAGTRTATENLLGTPMWMAPEQTDLGPVTPAADVWALALILTHALTGKSYWLAANDPEASMTMLIKEVILGDLPPVSKRAKQLGCTVKLPPGLDDVLARALVRDVPSRIADAGELWAALRPVLEGRGTASRPEPVTEGLGLHRARIAAEESAKPAPRPTGTMIAKPIEIPAAPSGKALLHSRPTPGWMKFAGGAIAFVLLGVGVSVRACMRESVQAARSPYLVAPPREQGRDTAGLLGPGAIPLPLSANAPTAKNAAAPGADGACRLCASDVKATGPVTVADVTTSIERELLRLDAQCLTRAKKKPKAGMTVLSFAISEGRATNRRIVSTSSLDGTDECLVRSLADVVFPAHRDETDVSITLAYDPAR